MIIRKIHGSISFANTIDDLLSIIMVYNGGDLTIGDVSKFSKQMRRVLYPFIEKHPNVKLYATTDINDELLLSRAFTFVKGEKSEYIAPQFERDMTYEDAEQLNISDEMKLRLVNTKKFVRDLCQNL